MRTVQFVDKHLNAPQPCFGYFHLEKCPYIPQLLNCYQNFRMDSVTGGYRVWEPP